MLRFQVPAHGALRVAGLPRVAGALAFESLQYLNSTYVRPLHPGHNAYRLRTNLLFRHLCFGSGWSA